METELSFDQTTFLLWVPPFLSYELWKLRIELWKLLIQTGSEHPKYTSSLMLILVREYAAIAAYGSMWQPKERDKHLRSTWSWALHMILEHKPLSFCCHIPLYTGICCIQNLSQTKKPWKTWKKNDFFLIKIFPTHHFQMFTSYLEGILVSPIWLRVCNGN